MQTELPPLRLDDLYSIERFAERHPDLVTATTLRTQLRDRHINGLAPAVGRVGKNLFLSESRYTRWLESRAGANQ